MESHSYLYFAYGSNLNPERMRRRIPEARIVGRATLKGWRLVERLYADIEKSRGGSVDGVLYLVTPTELHRLDAYEGYPNIYDCILVSVHAELMGNRTKRYRVPAFTYAMTENTRKERDGKPYPEVPTHLLGRCAVARHPRRIPAHGRSAVLSHAPEAAVVLARRNAREKRIEKIMKWAVAIVRRVRHHTVRKRQSGGWSAANNRKEKTMTKKKRLMAIRKACKERGVTRIEVTHHDGRKTRIDDRAAIAAAMDALDGALYKQIDALGGDEATSGMREIVRDWMLRDHPEERDMMEDFSETVTFDELVRRMRDGENFYEILECGESVQREHCFNRLSELTDTDYDLWYSLWLTAPSDLENAEERKRREMKRKRIVKEVDAVLAKIRKGGRKG